MDISEEVKSLSHNSYCIIGGDEQVDEVTLALRSKHNMAIEGNPDLFLRRYESFAIDDARELRSIHETKPVSSSGKKIFIVKADAFQIEAQNALLKLLEEPAEYAYFFLIVPSLHILIPTVLSRMHIVMAGNIGDSIRVDGTKFLNAPTAERLKTIATLVEDIKEEKKNRREAIDFLDSIERSVYEAKGPRNGKHSLAAIDTARKYLSDRSPSLKMLLEYVALNV